jgi:MarR family transcriptional regulator, organic hydroperoxide resistance regulator
MSYEQLKLENQLCFPFYAVSRLIIREYQQDLDRLGITYPQYLVMLVLWESDGVTVNDIAHRLILNTNTITPLLKRMETMNLITRSTSKEDQRKVIIQLTEKGKEMEKAAAEVPLNLIKKMGIEPNEETLTEINTLRQMMQKMIRLMNQKIQI